jgi:hypothetical protein
MMVKPIAILGVGLVLTACLNSAPKQQQELHSVATNAEMATWRPAERCNYQNGQLAYLKTNPSLSDLAKQDLLKQAASCNATHQQ